MSDHRSLIVFAVSTALLVAVGLPAVADEAPTDEVPQDITKPSEQAEPSEPEEQQEISDPPVDPDQTFDDHVEMQSAIEVELGIRHYQEGDDYRAISSLKRYRLLADDAESDLLANLLIGDIYRRNEYPDLALSHFWQASRAPVDSDLGFGAYHLGLQEFCVSMKAFSSCRTKLDEFQESAGDDAPELAELARYHKQFVDFVMRAPAHSDADFADPRLQRASSELDARNQTFEDLPLKSPMAAGILSAIIPGAGQAYNGRWLDGVLALGTTGLFATATAYSHFSLESLPLTIFSGIFTAGFYTGNIANAAVDAHRHNAAVYDDFFDALHRDLWPRLYLRVDDGEIYYDYQFDWPGLVDPDEVDSEPPPIPGML